LVAPFPRGPHGADFAPWGGGGRIAALGATLDFHYALLESSQRGMSSQGTNQSRTHRDTEILCVSVSLCLCGLFLSVLSAASVSMARTLSAAQAATQPKKPGVESLLSDAQAAIAAGRLA